MWLALSHLTIDHAPLSRRGTVPIHLTETPPTFGHGGGEGGWQGRVGREEGGGGLGKARNFIVTPSLSNVRNRLLYTWYLIPSSI